MTNKESLRPIMERLSRRLATEEGAQILALLQKLQLAGAADSLTAEPQQGPKGEIGIWKRDPNAEPKRFVRREDKGAEWRCWADVPTIEPKGARKRVVLLGESVARGYFYDPFVTPAKLLQDALGYGASRDADEPEVVDLARIDISGVELWPLLEVLEELEPDAIVLFAGNNWHNVPISPIDAEGFIQSLTAGMQLPAVKGLFERIVADVASKTLDRLAQAAHRSGASVTVIVPEFNLSTWRPEVGFGAPYLRGDAHLEWEDAFDRAEEALLQKRWDDLATEAERMQSLDSGLSAWSAYLCGVAVKELGDLEAARSAFELARDAPIGTQTPHSPRCPAIVQRMLREKAAQYGFALVDLPAVLAQRAPGELPGRRFFLDYCHMTLLGLEIAMSEAARCVGEQLNCGFREASAKRASDGAVLEHEGIAHVLAAIHNAHYGQARTELAYHCAQAVEKWAGAEAVFTALLECQPRQKANWACASFQELCRNPALERYLHSERGSIKLADMELWDAMCEVTSAPDARTKLVRLLLEERGAAEITDMLDPALRATTFREARGFALDKALRQLRAHRRSSELRFVSRGGRAGLLRITSRSRGTAQRGEDARVVVTVNGHTVADVCATSTWTRTEVEVPGYLVQAGVNVVTVRWPSRTESTDVAIARGIRDLECGRIPAVLPVFGEIAACTFSSPGTPVSEATR